MNYLRKIYNIFDNYVLARWQNRPSTAQFWYLSEPPIMQTKQDLLDYEQASTSSPRYLIDYSQKLKYSLTNEDNIIVLPYAAPIGQQINPEAAFQYALGLHEKYSQTNDKAYLEQFFKYSDYFFDKQTDDGMWNYDFNWFAIKAPWHSALAQARGASVMMRAWLHSKNPRYLEAAKESAGKIFTIYSRRRIFT